MSVLRNRLPAPQPPSPLQKKKEKVCDTQDSTLRDPIYLSIYLPTYLSIYHSIYL